MLNSPKLLLVGCGKMGSALLRGFEAKALDIKIVAVEPSTPSIDFKNLKNVTWINSVEKLESEFVPDVVLIAVKPQMIAEALPTYSRFTKAVFLSIAAGTTIATLIKLLNNPSVSIVRTMPNLPASIRQGVTAAFANSNVTSLQRELCDHLMKAVGEVAWIDKEELLDAVTALSGSGPAYVFALCEAMTKAGETLGLTGDISAMLARQTIIGSGALLEATQESASELRRAVTSPKGTTEAALEILFAENGLFPLLQSAMAAAQKRAQALSN